MTQRITFTYTSSGQFVGEDKLLESFTKEIYPFISSYIPPLIFFWRKEVTWTRKLPTSLFETLASLRIAMGLRSMDERGEKQLWKVNVSDSLRRRVRWGRVCKSTDKAKDTNERTFDNGGIAFPPAAVSSRFASHTTPPPPLPPASRILTRGKGNLRRQSQAIQQGRHMLSDSTSSLSCKTCRDTFCHREKTGEYPTILHTRDRREGGGTGARPPTPPSLDIRDAFPRYCRVPPRRVHQHPYNLGMHAASALEQTTTFHTGISDTSFCFFKCVRVLAVCSTNLMLLPRPHR